MLLINETELFYYQVNVLTTQGVQGREYRALIVSTVRTCRSETPDIDHESSFINDPKVSFFSDTFSEL